MNYFFFEIKYPIKVEMLYCESGGIQSGEGVGSGSVDVLIIGISLKQAPAYSNFMSI